MTNTSTFYSIPEVSVEMLAIQLATAPAPLLLDVREPLEVRIAQIPGFQNLPLSQFDQWSPQIHQWACDQEIYVLCHHGLRSAQVCHWLHHQGFTQAKNVAGGIDAYACRVDPTIPRY